MSLEPTLVVPVISYASPVEEIRYTWLLWFARAMGGLPLAGGLLTMLLFVLTRHEVFVGIGIWTIVVGVFMVAAGFVAILVYRFTNWLRDPTLRRQLNREMLWTILLQLVNFPAAYLCMISAAGLDEFR